MDKTKKQIKSEIEALEQSDFYLQMKDHWSQEDFHTHDVYNMKIYNLKCELRGIEDLEKEAFGYLEDLLDTMIEVGNGVTAEDFHKECQEKMFPMREAFKKLLRSEEEKK